MWAVILVGLLHLTAAVQIHNHGIPDAGIPPNREYQPTDCACRNREWTEALSQATSFPEHKYPN